MTSSNKDLKDPLLINDNPSSPLIKDQSTEKSKNAPESQDPPPVPFSGLYRFITPSDKIILTIAYTLSLAVGCSFPGFALIWGNTANAFVEPADMTSIVGKNSIYIGAIGLAVMVTFFVITALVKYVGQRHATRLRAEYLRAIVRQDMSFFDKIDPAELSSRVEDDCKTIIEGTEDKLVVFLYGLFTFIGGFIVAFFRGWQLSLILIGITPFQGITGFIYGRMIAKSVKNTSDSYAKAGAVAEQALSSIRTIAGLVGEEKECRRYEGELDNTKKAMIKFGLYQGISIGLFGMFSYIFYAFSFYFGALFIADGVSHGDRPYNGGDVLSVYFSIITGASSLAFTAPSLKAFASARQTAAKVYAIIDRKSAIDAENPAGAVLSDFEAKISFKDVVFRYPSNPDKLVLEKITFEIQAGKKTAIVGGSGSGKSTIVQLIERLYDPESGSIQLDGHDLRELNLKWLRKNISYVGQEPVLFTGTIRENLALAKEVVNEDEMIDALKKANAYDFVMKLEKKIDTYVGVGGIQLSGGQKQRIAIARAILRNTKILLLDEATSALDRKNEKTIQKTLDKVAEGLTAVIIAHRLSTVKNADEIIVLQEGKIVERGTHTELVSKQGIYYNLQLGQLNTEDLKLVEQEGEDNEQEDDSGEQLESSNNDDETVRLDIGNNREQKDEMKLGRKESSHSEQMRRQDSSNSDKIERKNSRTKHNRVHQSFEKKNSSVKEEAPPASAAPKANTQNPIIRLFTFSRPERPLFIASLVASVLMGIVSPALSILISKVLFVILPPYMDQEAHDKANFYSLLFLIVAFLVFFLYLFQFWFFAILAESLTNRIRGLVFNKFLRMHMAWHDTPENAAGILSTALATDATNVSTMTGSVIGLTLQAISSMITGIIIAFVASWQVALVSLLMVPIIGILGMFQAKVSAKLKALGDEIKQSGQVVSEVINNIRTVACLGREETFRERYETMLKKIQSQTIKLSSLLGLFLGANQFAIFLYFAVTFYVGALAATHYNLDPTNVFIGLFSIINAVFNVSGALRYMPDLTKANTSAQLLFKYIDMQSEIDVENTENTVTTPIRGDIEFRAAAFKYPTRENEVFKGLNLRTESGKKLALVGPSGCGKSTIIQLLMRFYDLTEGQILIDGVDIKKYNLKHLRKSFGFVSQEPVLFNGSIEYNIKYQKENATDEEMRDAARRANALDFIEKNEFELTNPTAESENTTESGFKRKVGPKGTQLSGGQKQRIAIARAILNNKSVLLLDEATSALDSKNEAIVQESLDKVTEGVTTVTIAHRFATIKRSDQIIVLKEGNIAETGTYEQLTELKGYFYQLERGLD